MSKALSVDLRERVVAAIAAGASCRAAAARFGVSAASAIRWRALERATGSVAPKALGGDRRSERTEAHAPLILDLST
jgi:transposase